MGAKINKPIAITFHGFLGSSKDFIFLDGSFETYNLDLKPKNLSVDLKSNDQTDYESWSHLVDRLGNELKNILDKIALEHNESEIFLFSYSMGSKALFSVLNKFEKELKTRNIKFKLILLSTHFGLYEDAHKQDQEQQFRTDMNSNFLKILRSHEVHEFINEWSSLSLFSEDRKEKIKTSWTKSQIEHYFKFWNQSQMVDQPRLLLSYSFVKSIHVIYGEMDLKYKEQAVMFKNHINFKEKEFNKLGHEFDLIPKVEFIEVPKRSHRLLQDSDFEILLNYLEVFKK